MRVTDDGALNVWFLDTNRGLCSVYIPLDELAERAYVVSESPNNATQEAADEARELAADAAAEDQLRQACRELFGALRR